MTYQIWTLRLKHEPSSVGDENKGSKILYRLGTKGKIEITEMLLNVSRVSYIYDKQPGRKVKGIMLKNRNWNTTGKEDD